MTNIESLLERIAAHNERIIEQNEKIPDASFVASGAEASEPALEKPKSN